MSRRSASNTASSSAQEVAGRGPERAPHDLGRVLAVLGQPLERPLDLLRLELAEIVHGSPPAELARAARVPGPAAAPVRLAAHTDRQAAAPTPRGGGAPLARRTGGGAALPAVPAHLADAAMPLRSSPRTMDSDATCRKRRLAVPGSRAKGWPESGTSGTGPTTPSIRR